MMTGRARLTSSAEVDEGKDKFSRCSKSVNCPMKLKLGEIFGRSNFTRLYASSNVIR